MEKITEENRKQKLLEYTRNKYTCEEILAAFGNCPYDLTWINDEELTFKELVDWFQLEWKNPKTGKTVVRRFTEDTKMAPWMKAEMLKMEQVRRSKFEIIEERAGSILVRDLQSGETITILLANKPDNGFFVKGRIFEGRIHPWKDAHMLTGILKVQLTEEELKQYATAHTPALRWVNGPRQRRESVRNGARPRRTEKAAAGHTAKAHPPIIRRSSDRTAMMPHSHIYQYEKRNAKHA